MQGHFFAFGSHQVVHNVAGNMKIKIKPLDPCLQLTDIADKRNTSNCTYYFLFFNIFAQRKRQNVGYTPARCVATSVTEPFLAGVAVHDTGWIMDTTIAEKWHNLFIFFILF